MSMDAGGLAQMTYNNFQPNGGLGMPSAGFASRGKGASLKRLSVASPPNVASISENMETPTPRTSRSHLLAGLRTAPKTPTSAQPPASAPFGQRQHNVGGNIPRSNYNGPSQGVPQTAVGSGFSGANQFNQQQQPQQQQQQQMMYDHVLAPPSLQFDDGEIDPNIAAQLMATELYLAQRQQQLQQQLLTLTAHQFGNMNLNGMQQSQAFPSTPYTPQANAYGQQMQNGSQLQETGQPGVYLAFNQLTGQYQYVVDPALQQELMGLEMHGNLSASPAPPTPGFAPSPPKSNTPIVQVSPPAEVNPSPWASRSSSPPKKSPTPPQNFDPLPPPSANAFRRGHKKNLSSLAVEKGDTPEGPKSALGRPAGFPATPMTGTFGPGQARAGEHPIRQPRGPPQLEELKALPTAKHEGSKNFAARQRRKAVGSLIRAGMGRRGQRSGSSGSASPASEAELSFPPSDNDSDSVRSSGSGSLSGKPSIGSLRAAANGAIGSERKASKERSRERTVDRSYTANSVSSDEGIGGGLVEIRANEPRPSRSPPRLIFTSLEKRKSTKF